VVRRPSPRARAAQWLLLLVVGAAIWWLAGMAGSNMERRHTTFGFGFLFHDTANFDIPFHLISWNVGDLYIRALAVCVLNTLLVSIMSIVAATLLGLLVGIMRLSTNWLVSHIALWFIEFVRNTPQLVQIIFWYVAVLQTLPPPRQSIAIPGAMLLNIRGFYLPRLIEAPWANIVWPLALAPLIATPFLWRATWKDRPIGARALVLPLAAVALFASGIAGFDKPALHGFNITGGVPVPPELVALWAGLSIYGAAFIAEIVRAAIIAVNKGQREAALSLGLRPRQVLAKVILPQALRIMIPPMTSQYLNLIKSSSLGAAVAYPELFQIFAGTVLQQTAREVEVMIILMAVFLSINLATSAFMNWYNRHVALVER
jgi:general L-amino acid transport system permease protein